MSLVLLNLDSNQQIKLDNQNPLIIGRKNVERCFDKRVSRNHGRITCTTDGKLRLEALHFNPCFFTRDGVPPVLQLNKNEEETLSEGDYLGLLPNAFWFKITSDKVTEIKIRPDNFEITSIHKDSEENIRTGNLHDNSSVTNSEADKAVTIKVNDSSVTKDEVNEGSLNPLPAPPSDSVINSTGLSKGFGSEEFEKTRRLPLWMYEIYDPMDGKKNSNKHTPSTSEKEKKQKHLPVAETDRSSRVHGKELPLQSTSSAKPEDKLPNTSQHENRATGKQVDGIRPICENGATCFIQTTQHRAQFFHPGDEGDESASAVCGESEKRSDISFGYRTRPDESVISPHPLKRSTKKTKVHLEHDHNEDFTGDYNDDYELLDSTDEPFGNQGERKH